MYASPSPPPPPPGPQSSPEQLAMNLQKCLFDEGVTNAIIISSTALFFYDYCLTIRQEIRYVWETKFTIANALFLCARYPAFLTATLILFPPKSSVAVNNAGSGLRVLAILSSDLIFALRTWAIWGRRTSILVVFIFAAVAVFVPLVVITIKDISTSMADPCIPEKDTCATIVSSVGPKIWILPYILIISYRFLTLAFALIKISHLHNSAPLNSRSSLLYTLQIDGILYFASTLVFGALNIGLIVQSPQLRQGGVQLQTIIHSIMAELSLEAALSQCCLTTHIEMEDVAVPPG